MCNMVEVLPPRSNIYIGHISNSNIPPSDPLSIVIIVGEKHLRQEQYCTVLSATRSLSDLRCYSCLDDGCIHRLQCKLLSLLDLNQSIPRSLQKTPIACWQSVLIVWRVLWIYFVVKEHLLMFRSTSSQGSEGQWETCWVLERDLELWKFRSFRGDQCEYWLWFVSCDASSGFHSDI